MPNIRIVFTDISQGGFGGFSDANISVNDEISFTCPLSGELFPVVAKITRCVSDKNGHRIGAEFVNPSKRLIECVKREVLKISCQLPHG